MPGPTILEDMGHQGTASHTVHDNGTETYWFNDGTTATYGLNGLIESTAVEKIGFGGVVGPDQQVTRDADRKIINVQDLSKSDFSSPTNTDGIPSENGQTHHNEGMKGNKTSSGSTSGGAGDSSASLSAGGGPNPAPTPVLKPLLALFISLIIALSIITLTTYPPSSDLRDPNRAFPVITSPPPAVGVSPPAAQRLLPQQFTPSPTDSFSDWMTSERYQGYFDQVTRLGWFPSVVEGRNSNGIRQFRAKFVRVHPGVSYWSHHNSSPEFVRQRNAELAAQGYVLVQSQSAQDAAGVFVQAVWRRPQSSLQQFTPSPTDGFSDWMTSERYQGYFDQVTRLGWFPSVVEGRDSNGIRQFRAKFVRVHPGVSYWSHHNSSPEFVRQRNAELVVSVIDSASIF